MRSSRILKAAVAVVSPLAMAGVAQAAGVIADFDAVPNPFSDDGGATSTVDAWWTSPTVANSYKTVCPSGYIGAFYTAMPRTGGLTDLLLSGTTLSFDYVVPNHAAPNDTVNPNPNAGVGYINQNLVVASDVDGWGWTTLPNAGLFLGNAQTWDWTGTYYYNYLTNADTNGHSLYSLLSHWNQGQGTYFNLVFVQQSGGASNSTVIRDNFQVLLPNQAAWNATGGGNWSTAANWQPAIAPSGNTMNITFGTNTTAASTVFTDSPVTAKSITFDSANSYAVAGMGGLTLAADSNSASINVLQGSHQFQVVVTLASNTDVSVTNGASLAFNNALNLGGNTLTKSGEGTMEVNNKLTTGGGSVVIASGTLAGVGVIGGDLSVRAASAVAPGGSIGTLTAASASLDGASLYWDLGAPGNNDVLKINGAFSASNVSTFHFSTQSGFTSGTYTLIDWDSTALTDVSNFAFDSIPGYSLSLANTGGELDLLVASSAPGVSMADFLRLQANYGQNVGIGGPGDLTGDGVVDAADLAYFQAHSGNLAGVLGQGAFGAVPEPAALGLLGLAALVTAGRRRRPLRE